MELHSPTAQGDCGFTLLALTQSVSDLTQFLLTLEHKKLHSQLPLGVGLG
jgi:hypothetical protein